MMAQRPSALTVSGCQHATVGSIVVGDFLLSGENHQRPVYKRTTQVKGFDVLCYFWDDRDGPDFSGWWFGPKVGGDQVWAYHPSKAMDPPPQDWKVPYGGQIDPHFRITPKGAQPMGQQMAAGAGWGLQAQGMQQQPAAGAAGQQQLQYHQQQHAHHQLQAQQHQQQQQQAYQQQQAHHQQQAHYQQQAHHQQQAHYQQQAHHQQQAHQQQQAHYQQQAHQQQPDWGQQQLHQQQQQHQQQQAWGQQSQQQQSHQQQGWGQRQQQQQPQQQQQQPQQQHQQQQQSWGSTSGSSSQQGHRQQGQKSWDQSGGGYSKSQSGGSGGWDKSDWSSWSERGGDRNKSGGGNKRDQWDRSSWHSKPSQDWNQSSWDSAGSGGGGSRKSGWEQEKTQQQQPQQPGLQQQQQQQQHQGQQGWGAQQQWGSQQSWGTQMQTSQPSWDAVEQERKAAEQRQKQQEELKKKVDEEKKKKQEAEQQRMRQQKAAFTIRKVLMKVRAAATVEAFEESKIELDQVLAQELQYAGNLKERIQEECTQGLAMGQKRVDAVLEQKRKEQEKKEAEAKAKADREARAKELVMELTVLVEATEADSQKLTEASQPLQEVPDDAGVATIKELSSKVNDAATKVRSTLKACSDFIIKNAPSMKEAPNPTAPAGPTPMAQELTSLMKRISECKKNAEVIADKVPDARNKALRRCHARERQKAVEATFKKYDSDNDAALSRKEIIMYAKEEFQFQVDDSMLARLWDAYVEDGSKGFTMDNFHLLKAAVGVAREQLRDVSRKEVKMAKQKAMDAAKGELADKVKAMAKEVDDVDKELTKLEKEVQPLQNKVRSFTVDEIVAKVAEVDGTIAAIRENTEATRKRSDSLSEGVENIISDEIRSFLASDATSKKMLATLGRMAPRLKRVEKLLTTFREAAEKKEAEDMEKLRQQALRVLWHNQRANDMTLEELFKDVDHKSDGKLDEAEFVRWFENADVEVREPVQGPAPRPAASPKKDDAADPKPESPAEEASAAAEPSGEAKAAGEPKPAEASTEPTDKVECIELPAESVKKVFASLLAEGATEVPQEDFLWFTRPRYIVIKAITLTANLEMTDGDSLDKLELGDILDVLQGPKREEATGTLRLMVRLAKDGREGWVTLIGNQGSAFLKKGGSLFKILKEAVLTENREVEEAEAVEDGKADSSGTKLKIGDLLEVHEGPVQEKPGVLRVRCKVRGTGATGWVTIRDQGTLFAKPL